MKTLTLLNIIIAPLVWSNTVPDFVNIETLAPSVKVTAAYFTSENFTGAPVAGYKANKCLLSRPAAQALARVQEQLFKSKRRLQIFDCYRPQKAVDRFLEWSRLPDDNPELKKKYYPREKKSDLFPKGYIAEKSGHSRGSTVDLTIEGFDMGSTFDLFDLMSNTDSNEVSQQAHANRMMLKSVMEEGGFRNFDLEWWHYTLRNEPYPNQSFNIDVE